MAQHSHLAENGEIPRYVSNQEMYRVIFLKYDRRLQGNIRVHELSHDTAKFKESIPDDEDSGTMWDMHEVRVAKTKCNGFLWRLDEANKATAARIIVEDRVFTEILRQKYEIEKTQHLILKDWDEPLTPGQPDVVDLSGELIIDESHFRDVLHQADALMETESQVAMGLIGHNLQQELESQEYPQHQSFTQLIEDDDLILGHKPNASLEGSTLSSASVGQDLLRNRSKVANDQQKSAMRQEIERTTNIRVQKLQKKYDQRCLDIQNLEEENALNTRNLEGVEAALEKLKKTCKSLTTKLSNQEKNLVATEAELEASKQDFEAHLQICTAERKEREKENSELSWKLKTAEDQLKETEQQMTAVQQRLDDYDESHEMMSTNQRAEINSLLDNHKIEMAKLQEKYTQEKTQKEYYDQRCQRQVNEITVLHGQFEDEHQDKLLEKEAREVLQARLEESEQQNVHNLDHIENLETQIEETEDRIVRNNDLAEEQRASERDTLQTEITLAKQELANQRRHFEADLEARQSSHQTEIRDLLQRHLNQNEIAEMQQNLLKQQLETEKRSLRQNSSEVNLGHWQKVAEENHRKAINAMAEIVELNQTVERLTQQMVTERNHHQAMAVQNVQEQARHTQNLANQVQILQGQVHDASLSYQQERRRRMEVEGTLQSHDTWCPNNQAVNQDQPYYGLDNYPPLGSNYQHGNTDGMNQYYDQNVGQDYQEEPRGNPATARSGRAPNLTYQPQESLAPQELTVHPVIEVRESNQTREPQENQQIVTTQMLRESLNQTRPVAQQHGMEHVLSQMAKNLEQLHQVGTKDYAYSKFSGKPGTINIKDWINRMEESMTPDMSEEMKIKNLLKYLDPKVDVLNNIINAQFVSYSALTRHLKASFGLKQQPFTLSDWSKTRRWAGNTIFDWLNSPDGLMLVQQTSIKWDTQQYTDDEILVVVNNLLKFVPRSALEDYMDDDNYAWDCNKFRAIKIHTLMVRLGQSELNDPHKWAIINDRLPKGSGSKLGFQLNSINTNQPATTSRGKGRGRGGRGGYNQGRNPSSQDFKQNPQQDPQNQFGTNSNPRGGYIPRGSKRGGFDNRAFKENSNKDYSIGNWNSSKDKEIQNWANSNDSNRGRNSHGPNKWNQQHQQNQNPAQRTQDGYYHNKGNKSNRGSKRGGYKDRTRRINAIENEDYEDYQEYDNTQQYTQSQNQDQYQQNPQIVSNIQRQGQDHQAFRGTSQVMDVTPKNWRAPLESEENSQRVGVVRYSDKNPYRK